MRHVFFLGYFVAILYCGCKSSAANEQIRWADWAIVFSLALTDNLVARKKDRDEP